MRQHYQFLCFRSIDATIGADTQTVEIKSCIQLATAVNPQVPVDGIGIVRRHTTLSSAPEQTSRRVEDLQLDIQKRVDAVVDNAERGAGLGWIGISLHIDEDRFQSLDHVKGQFCCRRIIHDIPGTELELVRSV